MRLQARRHGAGLAVSEMVSSFALHYRNERTLRELLRIHPDEHPVSIQLFGHDAEVMRSGAAIAAEAGADLIDINMGCPVPKVRKTGAGAELLRDPELALALARGAREGSGRPVTVKLRSGHRARRPLRRRPRVRLAEEAGVAAIGFHPRARRQAATGRPDYALARELVERLDGPGDRLRRARTAPGGRRAYEESGADAVMIARGALGNPWIFEELTGRRGGRAERRRDRRRAALGHRPSGGAPGRRTRRALPAQVLPLVPRSVSAPRRGARRVAADGRPRPRAASWWRAATDPAGSPEQADLAAVTASL